VFSKFSATLLQPPPDPDTTNIYALRTTPPPSAHGPMGPELAVNAFCQRPAALRQPYV
jgi:hypothetical protein